MREWRDETRWIGGGTGVKVSKEQRLGGDKEAPNRDGQSRRFMGD
jgi:hypothetical protein